MEQVIYTFLGQKGTPIVLLQKRFRAQQHNLHIYSEDIEVD